MVRATAVRTPVLGVLAVALALGALATVPLSAGAVPDASCAGSGGGALFVADSGFTVEYNDSQPMPDNGPFRGEDTLRFRNVTVSSSGDAFLRLENGTGPETCLAAVDAGPASVRIAPDGEQAVVIDGAVDALSFGNATYGPGSVDFAYEAGGAWSLTIPSTGLDGGTEIVAVDGTGTEIATATVDASGELVLALPDGSRQVDLQEPTAELSVVSASAGSTDVLVNDTVEVTAEIRNDGDASGDYTATLTANSQAVADETVTVVAGSNETVTLSTSFAQAGTYSLAVDGQNAGEVTVSEPTAQISVTSATAASSEVVADDQLEVTVELRNDGEASGEYTATLTADGQPLTNQNVTVAAGATESITMTTTFSLPGTYSLAVDGQDAGQITVTEPQPSDDTDDGTGDGSTDDSGSDGSADDGGQDDSTDGGEQDGSADGGGQDGSGGSGPPWLLILVLIAILAAAGGYVLAQRGGGDAAQSGQASDQSAAGGSAPAAGGTREESVSPDDDSGGHSNGAAHEPGSGEPSPDEPDADGAGADEHGSGESDADEQEAEGSSADGDESGE